MLYDFHQKQNAKKPGSVHATYLLIGRPRPDLSQHTNGTHIQDGADSIMQGSPPVSSMPEREETEEEVVPVTKITLATEEKLEGMCGAMSFVAHSCNCSGIKAYLSRDKNAV